MPNGRKMCICVVCKEEKVHFGFGKCSSCLRNWKRKNKPSFYLGTCYSEISRRIKTFDSKRPNYYGLPKCTRDEFINSFKDDSVFLEHWNNWKLTDFKRGNAPSIDRIDNTKGYTLDNLQWLKHCDNGKKDWAFKMIVDYGSDNELHFESQLAVANYLDMCDTTLCNKFKEENPILVKGRMIYKIYA
jgi:hypothetical protein